MSAGLAMSWRRNFWEKWPCRAVRGGFLRSACMDFAGPLIDDSKISEQAWAELRNTEDISVTSGGVEVREPDRSAGKSWVWHSMGTG